MFTDPKFYDIIVVGAGHAGVEAALAGSRMGCQVLLLTINADTVGQMSCNPAIGGLAKGHLAREIDALGGEMGKNTDMTGLQFRMLNTSKGPAVWAPRAQCDKKAYQFRLKWICERQENLDLRQGQISRLILADGKVCGVETTLGVLYNGRTVIITTGTFLKGLMHVGSNQQSGGRSGEASAMGLSSSLIEAGLKLGRLKTGTPPRLLRRSLDLDKMTVQIGDEPVPYFSYWKNDLFHVEHSEPPVEPLDRMFHVEQKASTYPPSSILSQIRGQLPCYVTYTTDATAQLIRANIDKSPMYSGVIQGTGPRYCPSIEDKIVKFPEKERQQIFIEPEGISTDEIYVNGFSTCLPFEVQYSLVRTITGCERAEILRPAYAVEYDFAFPTQLQATLETKMCENLFLAGQINGTSGYEEAGAQGLIAGINAARKVLDKPPLILRRDQAYIGVLIDDLITKGTVEPYRMFTSRAEYRLLLRQDNADSRLSEIAFQMGSLPKRNYELFVAKRQKIEDELTRLRTTRLDGQSLHQILRRPEIRYNDLQNKNNSLSHEVITQVEIETKYQGYVARQEIEVAKFRKLENKIIPSAFDYSLVPSLRTEARQKFIEIRPHTVGQAARISGVSPADISILLVWLRRGAESNDLGEPEPQATEEL